MVTFITNIRILIYAFPYCRKAYLILFLQFFIYFVFMFNKYICSFILKFYSSLYHPVSTCLLLINIRN